MTDVSTLGASINDELSSLQVAEYVRVQLSDRGYKFTVSKLEGVETLGFNGKTLEITVLIVCSPVNITFLATLPVVVKDAHFLTVLKRLNEINTGLAIGAFEIYNEGNKVWFKIGVPVPPMPDADYLERILVQAVDNADNFAEELLNLLNTSVELESSKAPGMRLQSLAAGLKK